MIAVVGLVFGAAVAAFLLSFIQARINARHGTDHAVHTFLINCIRDNGGKGFVRIPRLLNEAYIGALPLYLHWIFARFPIKVMRRAELLLNPVVNLLHTVAIGSLALIAAAEIDAHASFAGGVAILFGLTPQFYHALSARNFGLSARSLGLLFLSGVFFFTWRVGLEQASGFDWLGITLFSFLVIAFSTFGLQVLVLVGAGLVLLGYWQIALGGVLGAALFFLVHPSYAKGYLSNTVRFVRAYAKELAPRYVLARRYSIWRDLYRDIWVRLRDDGVRAGFRYAYENSVLILVGLNPLTALAAIMYFARSDFTAVGLVPFAGAVSVAGTAIALLTSLRPLRFLGEPERYAEAVTPFAVLYASAILYQSAGIIAFAPIAIAFLAFAIAQVYASRVLAGYLSSKPLGLAAVQDAIDAAGGPVRLASNNEQYIKLMLPNPWNFSYCIAVGHGYCGMSVAEAFDPFPYLTRPAMARVVESCRINYCLLDRQRFDTLFDTPPDNLVSCKIAFETEGLRLLRLEWHGQPKPPQA